MSIVSTENLSDTKTNIKCFNDDLLKPKHEKYWGDEVLATASTGEFWEDDPSEKVKRRVNELQRIFHQERGLQVKNLPRDVTEDEVRELLSDFPVHSVQIVAGVSGSVFARVTLEDPEMLEEWDRDRVFVLRNQRLPVAPERSEMVLCVARLPLRYSEEKFAGLVRNYGEISMCFLMISEKTGDSKGYGFVKYTNKDAALKAKDLLNGKEIESSIVCCDWLDMSHVTFASLHSKCLYVDKLPPDFHDMGEFRKIFSTVVSPPYCQIALKNGCPQNWGLVEFNSAEDAENTQISLNNFKLKDSLLRISYCIPGVRAINLYLTLLNDSDNKEKSALLPDPPGPAVFQQFQSLAMRNPVFAQNLQNIIMQSTQKGNNLLDISKKGGASSGETSTPIRLDPSFTGLGGIDNIDSSLGVNLDDPLQLQMDNSLSPLVRNPQMLAIMQSLLNKQFSTPYGLPIPVVHDNSLRPPLQAPNWIGNALPSQVDPIQFPHRGLRQLHSGLNATSHSESIISRKVNLKPEPLQKASVLHFPSETIQTEESSLKRNYSKSLAEASGREMVGMHVPTPQMLNNSLISGILTQLQSQAQFNLPGLEASKNAEKRALYDRDIGLLDPNPNVKHTQFPVKPVSYPTDLQVSSNVQQTINTLMDNSNIFHSIFGTLTNAGYSGSKSEPRTPTRGASLLPTPNLNPSMPAPSPQVHSQIPLLGLPNRNLSAGIHNPFPASIFQTPRSRGQPMEPMLHNRWLPESNTSAMLPNLSMHRDALESNASTPPNARGRSLAINTSGWPSIHPGLGAPLDISQDTNAISSAINEHARKLNEHARNLNEHARNPMSTGLNSLLWSPPITPRHLPGGSDVQWGNHGGSSLLGSPRPFAVTPVGQKRKYDRILPSPEPSPEGNYIGQHSQGLGGHYADSYFKRKRN